MSVLAYFGVQRVRRRGSAHWVVPVCGIVVVLAVFSGMSALAVKVGLTWLFGGLVYGRAEVEAPRGVACGVVMLRAESRCKEALRSGRRRVVGRFPRIDALSPPVFCRARDASCRDVTGEGPTCKLRSHS